MATPGTAVRVMMTPDDEKLVKRTVRWVLASHCGGSGQLEEELYHCGLLGLVEAKRAFDSAKGVPFSAFAVHRIKGAMVDHLRAAPVIRLPQKKQELRRRLDEARQELRRDGSEPGDEQLAGHLGWPVHQVHQVANLAPKVVSLTDGSDDDGGDEVPQRDVICSRSGPEARLLKKELAVVVQRCLERLRSARDRLILLGRVVQGQTLKDLAESFSCSLETIRLRQQQAAEVMRRCLEANGWDGESLNELRG